MVGEVGDGRGAGGGTRGGNAATSRFYLFRIKCVVFGGLESHELVTELRWPAQTKLPFPPSSLLFFFLRCKW